MFPGSRAGSWRGSTVTSTTSSSSSIVIGCAEELEDEAVRAGAGVGAEKYGSGGGLGVMVAGMEEVRDRSGAAVLRERTE